MNQEKTTQDLHDFIKTWTGKYNYSIKKNDKENNTYQVEFSIPTQQYPIPQNSVICNIYLGNNELQNLKFRFEDDDLIHTLDNSMKFSSIEKYIDEQIKNKQLVRDYYFLGTHYERTRIKDKRIDKLKEIIPEEVYVNEILFIKDKKFLKSKKQIKFQNQDKIKEENMELFLNKIEQVYTLIDPNFMKFVSVDSYKNFIKLLGIDIENFTFLDNFLYRDNKLKNGIIPFKTIVENTVEIVLSKFLFEIVSSDFKKRKLQYEEEAIKLFYFQHKHILHKFRVFLHNLEVKGELSSENLKLNIQKIKDKILTESQYEKIIQKINEVKLITRSFIPQLMNMICEGKKIEYSEKHLESDLNEFAHEILKVFNIEHSMNEQEFKEQFYNKETIFIPQRQVGILWELLNNHGYLENGRFDLKSNVFLIENYLRKIFTYSDFLKTSFKVSDIDEQFYEDFEMPSNLSIKFLENAPLNKKEAANNYFKHLQLDEQMVNYLLENYEKTEFSDGFYQFFRKLTLLDEVFESLIGEIILFD